MTSATPIRIATRGSALARWQADRVGALLAVPYELVLVQSDGDKRRDVPIHAIGGVGVFTAAIQDAVLSGEADLAVHSAKDLPARTHDALVLAAIPERADVRDAMLGRGVDDLPDGATVATGSVRRRAQLAAHRPDLTFCELRGNMDTRIAKSLEIGAGVAAYAALIRLGLADQAAQVLDPEVMLPQVAQGALAVECRADHLELQERLAKIDDLQAHDAVNAERAYLEQLGGGCSLPCGAWARLDGDGALMLDAFLGSVDGEMAIRVTALQGDAETPADLGRRIAAEVRVQGGDALLAEDVAR